MGNHITTFIFITLVASLGGATSLCEVQLLKVSPALNNVVAIDALNSQMTVDEVKALSERHQKFLKRFRPFLSKDLTRLLYEEARFQTLPGIDGIGPSDEEYQVLVAQKMVELFKDNFTNRENLRFMADREKFDSIFGSQSRYSMFPDERTADNFFQSSEPRFQKASKRIIREAKIRTAMKYRLRWPAILSYRMMKRTALMITGTPEKDLILQELFYEAITPLKAIEQKKNQIECQKDELYCSYSGTTKFAQSIVSNFMNILTWTILPGVGMGLVASSGTGSASGLFFAVPAGLAFLSIPLAGMLSASVDIRVSLGLKPLQRELRKLQSSLKNSPRIAQLINQAGHSYYLGIVNEESLKALEQSEEAYSTFLNTRPEVLEQRLLALNIYMINLMTVSNMMRDRSFKIKESEKPDLNSTAYEGTLQNINRIDLETFTQWQTTLLKIKSELETMEDSIETEENARLLDKLSQTRQVLETLLNVLANSDTSPQKLPYFEVDGVTPEALLTSDPSFQESL